MYVPAFLFGTEIRWHRFLPFNVIDVRRRWIEFVRRVGRGVRGISVRSDDARAMTTALSFCFPLLSPRSTRLPGKGGRLIRATLLGEAEPLQGWMSSRVPRLLEVSLSQPAIGIQVQLGVGKRRPRSDRVRSFEERHSHRRKEAA